MLTGRLRRSDPSLIAHATGLTTTRPMCTEADVEQSGGNDPAAVAHRLHALMIQVRDGQLVVGL